MIRYTTGLMALMLVGGCAAQMPADSASLQDKRMAGVYKPTTDADMKAIQPDNSHAGTPVDLTGFKQTFNDDFDKMSVTDERGTGPWYSPVHYDFGASHLVGPREGKGPVFVRDGKLVIQLMQENGKWISSNVQTLNKQGQGFAQQYGYFEMRAKFPVGKPVWTAFWLHSDPHLTGPLAVQTEIDIVEAYNADPRGHHAAMHLWPRRPGLKGDVTEQTSKGYYVRVDGMFEGFHTYGAMVTPEWTYFYYDRKELSRMPTKPEFRTPVYMLADLAMLDTFKNEGKGVMEMEIDSIKAWQKTTPWQTDSLGTHQ